MSNEEVNPCRLSGCHGNCCRGRLIIDVENHQLEWFKASLNLDGDKTKVRASHIKGLSVVTLEDGCPALDKDFNCRIYNQRPIGCRELKFESRECHGRRWLTNPDFVNMI